MFFVCLFVVVVVVVVFSLVQPLHRLGRRCVCVWGGRGVMTDDSAQILFQSILWEAIVSSSGLGRDVHCLTLSIQHFLCQPEEFIVRNNIKSTLYMELSLFA